MIVIPIRSVLTDAQTCRQFRDNHALDTEHGMGQLQMETTWAVPGQRRRYVPQGDACGKL